MKEKIISFIINYILSIIIIGFQIVSTFFLYQKNYKIGYVFIGLFLLCILIILIYSYFKKYSIIKNILFIISLFIGLICGWVLLGINCIIGGFILSIPYVIYSFLTFHKLLYIERKK